MLGSTILLLFLFGGLGALTRFGLGWGLSLLGCSSHWGTVLINILGCFGFGFFAAFLDSRITIPNYWKPIILTGFFGAFTTFSTYLFDFHTLTSTGRWITTVLSFILQNALGLTALFIGLRLGR